MSDIRRRWLHRRMTAESDARMKPWLETLCKRVLSRDKREPAASPESVSQMRDALRTLGCAFIDTTDDVDGFIAALIERCEQLEADRAHYAGDAGHDSCAAAMEGRDRLKSELNDMKADAAYNATFFEQFSAGQAAHAEGKPLADNPHEDGILHHEAWEHGWCSSDWHRLRQMEQDIIATGNYLLAKNDDDTADWPRRAYGEASAVSICQQAAKKARKQ